MVAFLLTALLAGCSQPAAVETAAQATLPQPSAALPPPTRTPLPPTATPTALPPTFTPTLTPTLTPAPTLTATPLPTATPVPLNPSAFRLMVMLENGAINWMTSDGQLEANMAGPVPPYASPAYHAGKKKLAAIGMGEIGQAVFVGGADGSGMKLVFEYPMNAQIYYEQAMNLQWSADGRYLTIEAVEVNANQMGLPMLHILSAQGAVIDIYKFAVQARWSPQGHEIAYVAPVAQNQFGVVVQSMDTGKRQVLPRPEMQPNDACDRPAWRPDGKALLMVCHIGTERNLYLTSADAEVATLLGASKATTADWSPDGQLIAFTDGSSLFIMDASGANIRQIATSSKIESLKWSPDGRQIAFLARVAGWSLLVVEPNGNGLKKLAGDLASPSDAGTAVFSWIPPLEQP